MDTQNENGRILIVDDTKENLQLLGGVLLNSGYEVNFARSGIQALEAVNVMPPDLILLDIMMPEMDGFETCKRLKSDEATKGIPVIFLTAKTESESITQGFGLGAVDYITKPFRADELTARVRTHLQLRFAQKEIERQKKTLESQNKDLLEVAKLRDDVDNILRHDLKNPLNVVIGYPQVLKERETLTEKGLRQIKMIADAGYRMLNMINSSLDLLKMERGVYLVSPARVDILQVIKKVETEFEEIKRQKNLVLKLELFGGSINETSSFCVSGEELLCHSMLSNLIKPD